MSDRPRSKASALASTVLLSHESAGADPFSHDHFLDGASLLVDDAAEGDGQAVMALLKSLECGPLGARCASAAALGCYGMEMPRRRRECLRDRGDDGVATVDRGVVREALLKAARDPHFQVRCEAVRALRLFSNDDTEPSGFLTQCLLDNDESSSVRKEAVASLVAVVARGDEAVVNALLQAMMDPALRCAAAVGLSHMALRGNREAAQGNTPLKSEVLQPGMVTSSWW